jgi:ribonuclease HI
MRTSKCFATDGSKMENKPNVGFTTIDINDGFSWKLKTAKLASTFTAEALAIGETLEIIKKNWEQNFVIFSDSERVLKRISNTSTMYNTSHIISALKDEIERLESQGKIQFYWISGHCGVEVNETADSEAKQSIKEDRDSQLPLPVAYLKAQ